MLEEYLGYFKKAAAAGRLKVDATKIEEVLTDLADAAVKATDFLLQENKKDLDRMDPKDPKYDRLTLTAERIAGITDEIRNVAGMESPLGHVLSHKTMPNGLHISKISVPLGVIGVIYEARPNVTFDVFSLCFKTGNVCMLKGGSDADFSNRAIISVIHKVLSAHHIDNNVATLLPAGREAADALLHAVGYVDVLIPRGSQQLIDHVRNNSKVPVIETGAGIVHTYFDETADLDQGSAIVFNAKSRRVSVCNALDCLIIHKTRLNDLPHLVAPLAATRTELFADNQAFAALKGRYPDEFLKRAEPVHFGTEFLAMKMAIKVVDDFEAALEHINGYSSKHSEAILSEDAEKIQRFLDRVDAAAVYVNASTAFTDGAQFGLGAEIGISTQKLHARGPMGLQELCSYKWIVKGTGQTRK